jgi:hypothetical protein
VSDVIALALIRHLLETGVLDAADVDAIAGRVERSDHMAAHQVRCEMIEAAMPSDAERRRAAMRAVVTAVTVPPPET